MPLWPCTSTFVGFQLSNLTTSTGASPHHAVTPALDFRVLRHFPYSKGPGPGGQFYAPGNLRRLSRCVFNRRNAVFFEDCSHPKSPALQFIPLPSTMTHFGDSNVTVVTSDFCAYAPSLVVVRLRPLGEDGSIEPNSRQRLSPKSGTLQPVSICASGLPPVYQ
jgi:hypothetical protein